MAKKYIVRLTEAERTYWESLIDTGKVAAYKRLHAEILLKADMSELGEKWLDSCLVPHTVVWINSKNSRRFLVKTEDSLERRSTSKRASFEVEVIVQGIGV